MNHQKTYLLASIVSVLVLAVGVSFAYFTVQIQGLDSAKTINVSAKELTLTFTESTDVISINNLKPGTAIPNKSFTVVSGNLDSDYKYNIIIDDLVNTFVTTGYLQYKITGTGTGAYSDSNWVNVPKAATATDTIIATDVSIAANTTHSYTVSFQYINDPNFDQSSDMNKTFSGRLAITRGSTQGVAN